MNFEETNGIQTGAGVKLVIYGQEGVGKTSLAAQLPGAVFLDCEGSTSKMNVRRLPKPTSWEMLQQEVDFVLESHVQRQYQTLCIDTFDWAERLAITQLCSKHQVNGIEGFDYGKGWEYEAEEIGRFLDKTERLIQAGINVALLCHAITRKTSLPEINSDFDHWELKLGNKTTNKIAPLLKEWSDITLFLAFQTHVIATDDKGKKTQGDCLQPCNVHHENGVVGCEKPVRAAGDAASGICVHCVRLRCSCTSCRTCSESTAGHRKGTGCRTAHGKGSGGIGAADYRRRTAARAPADRRRCPDPAHSGRHRTPAGTTHGSHTGAAVGITSSSRQQGLLPGRYARAELSAGLRGRLVHSVVAEHRGHDPAEPENGVILH